MPKYQIILRIDKQLTDQEFQDLVQNILDYEESKGIMSYKLLAAQNLEGIREELWQLKEEIKDFTTKNAYFKQVIEDKIKNTFEEINQLFKL